jgi:hypothetical protein
VTQALPITRDGAGVDLEAAYAELFDARRPRLTTVATGEGYDEGIVTWLIR